MVYLFEEYELDDQNFCLTHRGRRVPLEPKSLNVLLLLVSGRGKLVPKRAILEAVWKETFVEEATLTRAIALIRKQLGDDSRSPRFIETVPTLGYRFIARVEATTKERSTPVGMKQEHGESSVAEAEPTAKEPEPPQRPPVPTHSATRAALLWLGSLGVVLALAMWLMPHRTIGPLESRQITFLSDPKDGPLFTDGSRLYFESRGVPVETPVSGGGMVPTRVLQSGMTLLDISADGSKILALKVDLGDISGRGTLWAIPALGGTPREISSRMTLCARWSPDGRSVVLSDQRALYFVDADGANERKIWESPNIFQLSISPDSRQISATVGNPGTPRIWTLQSDGKNAHMMPVVWPAGASQEAGQWTPDGRHFIFTSNRDGPANVYELSAPLWFEFWKKPIAVRLTGNQVSIVAAAPSPDSKTIFVLGRLERGAMQEFDSRVRRFVPCCNELSAFEFVISPDHQWMVYREYPSSYLWRSRLDGSEKLQLTHTFSVMEQWSPDSKWLVYSANYSKLYRVSVEGVPPEKLLEQGENEVSPTWSADGRSIAFHYFPAPDQPSTGIQILDVANRTVSTMPGSEGLYYPSWSPDGKYMVAISQSLSQMMLYNSETQTWKMLHKFEAPWGNWAWSNDSKSLYMALVAGQNGLYRLAVPAGTWERVSGFEDINLPPGAMAQTFVSITAPGQPAIMTDTSVAQIYSLSWNR